MQSIHLGFFSWVGTVSSFSGSTASHAQVKPESSFWNAATFSAGIQPSAKKMRPLVMNRSATASRLMS